MRKNEVPCPSRLTAVAQQFGEIDIYLFDQLLKGRITPDMRILDAGCGNGRNLIHLLKENYTVFGVDASTRAIEETSALSKRLAPTTPADRFRVERIEALSFHNSAFDVIICSAVLHFAEGPTHFKQMLTELWRVLAPGGLLFTRLASSIGLEDRVTPLDDGRYRLPDGTVRYLVDEATLLNATTELGGRLADPVKTTNVQGQRCMTTWNIWKEKR
tara:strand:+ start:3624 stop:4271 length:648 start_codon:yes stop_codon:yes gene_type:complete